MIILGVILLLLGLLFGIPILWTIGLIVAIVGVVLWIAGIGRPHRGRTTPLLLSRGPALSSTSCR